MPQSSGSVAFALHDGNFLNQCGAISPPFHRRTCLMNNLVRRRSRLFKKLDDVGDDFSSNNASVSTISFLEADVDNGRIAKDTTLDIDTISKEEPITEALLTMEQAKIVEKVDETKKSLLLQSISMPSNSVLLLNFVAIIWGSQHAVIKTCVSDLDPSSFSLVRFFLGAMIATLGILPLNINEGTNTISDKTTEGGTIDGTTLRWGAEMGLWMFLGYAFQAIGLEYTTAQKSGFLLYLNVKFVPFFAFALLGRSISLPTWVSAFSALIGTALLAYDGNSLNLNIGDAWSIAAAAASAMYILRLEKASAAVTNSAALNAACLWFVAGASIIWSAQVNLLNVNSVVGTIKAHPWELFYLSAVTTSLANWIQTKAQQNVSAERASVIYAMDPVWGAIWANVILGETLSSYGILGAGVITVAAATNAFLDFGKED